MDSINTLAARLQALGEDNNYNGQAQAFLDATQTVIEVVEQAPQRVPQWASDKLDKHGRNYAVTIRNPRGSFTFDYWGSIRDQEMLELAISEEDRMGGSPEFFKLSNFIMAKTGKRMLNQLMMNRRKLVDITREAIKPSAYDILTCMHVMTEDNFKDWCASFGYDDDSIKAERLYRACVEQDRRMMRLFTQDELEALNEIT